MRYNILILVGMMFVQPVFLQQTRCAEETRINLIENLVKVQAKFAYPLAVSSQPELRDELISLNELDSTGSIFDKKIPVFLFYKVFPALYEIHEGNIISEAVELDNSREWIAAIDGSSDMAILLKGAEDPITNFNQLMRNVKIRINSNDSAIELFDFFLKVVYGQDFRSEILRNSIELESKALYDFSRRFPTGKQKITFNKWWKLLPEKIKKSIKAPWSGCNNENIFQVEFFRYKKGQLFQMQIMIMYDGTVVEGKTNTLYG